MLLQKIKTLVAVEDDSEDTTDEDDTTDTPNDDDETTDVPVDEDTDD